MDNYPFNTPRKLSYNFEIEEPYQYQRISQDHQRNLLYFGSPISPEEVLRISNDDSRQSQQHHHSQHQYINKDIRAQNTHEYTPTRLCYDRLVPRITDANQIPFIDRVQYNQEDKVLQFSRNSSDQRNNKGMLQEDQEWLERKEMILFQQHSKNKKRLQPKAKSEPQISLLSTQLLNKKALDLVAINDSQVLSIAINQTILIYNLQTKNSERLNVCSTETCQSNYVSSLSWCPDKQNELGVGDNSGALSIWDAVKGEVAFNCFPCLSSRINVLAWNTPNLLTATDSQGIIYNIDVRARGLIAQKFYSSNKEAIRTFKWNQQNTALISSFKGQVAIWNVFKGQTPVRTIKCSNTSKVNQVAWSGLKKDHFLTGGDSKDSSLKLWDSVSGRNLDTVTQPTASYQSSVSDNCEVLHIFASHNNFPGYYAISTGSTINELTIWQEQENMKLKQKHSLQNSRYPQIYGNISSIKESIITASKDGFIKVWDCFELGRSNLQISKTQSLLDEDTSCVR